MQKLLLLKRYRHQREIIQNQLPFTQPAITNYMTPDSVDPVG